MRRILLTGKNGQVGWELQRTLAPLGEMVAVDRRNMDLSNPDSIRKIIREIRPDLIVNAAAYTAVDKAESEPDLAMAINGLAPGVMAEEAKRLNAAIVHFSTDYVFDGTKKQSYVEEDAPNPLNVYGKTKLVGEQAIQVTGVPHLILRTSWVYGTRGKNFLLTILRLSRERNELKIVDDQIGAPTWSRMLAEVTSLVLTQHNSTASLVDVSGVYHVTSGGLTSWFGFAGKIIEYANQGASRPEPKLIPIPSMDYPAPARRPLNSGLSNERLRQTFDLTMPSWEGSLQMCMDETAGTSGV